MPVNNYKYVMRFLPGQELGPADNKDHFIYTELLDRTKRVGNNGVRIVKTFYHRNLEDFDRHFEQMRDLCDHLKVRAYTRLAPRSFEKVGKHYAKMVTEAVVSNNWAGMKSLYTRACGTVTPEKKLWMFDVDELSEASSRFGRWLQGENLLLSTIPSKRGLHYITPAFDLRRWDAVQRPDSLVIHGVGAMSLHKDNATNLYIPDDAA